VIETVSCCASPCMRFCLCRLSWCRSFLATRAQEAIQAAKDVPLEKIQGVIRKTQDALPDSVPNPLRKLLLAFTQHAILYCTMVTSFVRYHAADILQVP
jgi:hypothetical protein